jgi:hypothetical protein
MPTADAPKPSLATSHGFAVFAWDGPVGSVDTPLFPPDSHEPDYLVVQTKPPSPRRPVVSTALVEHVDPARQIVYVRGTEREVSDLPEHLPLASGERARQPLEPTSDHWR